MLYSSSDSEYHEIDSEKSRWEKFFETNTGKCVIYLLFFMGISVFGLLIGMIYSILSGIQMSVMSMFIFGLYFIIIAIFITMGCLCIINCLQDIHNSL